MIRINLLDFYPEIYSSDEYCDVPDLVVMQLIQWKKDDHAMKEKIRTHRAYYSLDCDDGIERDALFPVVPPANFIDWQATISQLYTALASLPVKQAKRLYAHFFLGMSKTAIAQAEGVNEGNVRKSITRALRNMEVYLKKTL